tara:strand:+ start:556 stop:1086 length:531 start_codon:yes stop_codon:yes gene_type:complete
MTFSISPQEYQNYEKGNINQIYGEIDGYLLQSIIEESPIVIESILDVGSGCGRALIIVAKNIPYLQYLCGIENNKYRYNKSIDHLTQCELNIQHKLEFVLDDFTNHSFSQVDFVYCCNTMFDEDLNKQLVDKCLSECKHVFLLFTLEPRCLSFFWKKFQVKTSWMDKVTVFMYYKN